MTAEVSAWPCPQDVRQLESARQMHQEECAVCAPGELCPLGQRLADAVRMTGDVMSEECTECARLEREKEEARRAGNLSRVTDCNVLIKRHPDHSERLAPAGKGWA